MSKLCIVGDAYFDRKIEIEVDKSAYLLLNLEYVMSKREVGFEKVGLSSTYNWKNLVNPEKTLVSLANNHTLDAGVEGLEEMLQYLDKHKIGYFGAGTKSNNYNNPYRLKMGKDNLLLLSYNCVGAYKDWENEVGIATYSEKRVRNDIIKCLDIENHKIVVCIHWGVEESPYPLDEQRRIAHDLIDMGVNCVVGHHPHCIQPYEKYKGKYIFYSLGNFFFPDFKTKAFKNREKPEGITYRKRQLWWNKKSILAIVENLDFEKIETIAMKQKKNKVIKSGVYFNKHKGFSKIRTYIRKIVSMIVSNIITDKKLVDISYFLNEFKLIKKKKAKEKLHDKKAKDIS